MSQTLGVDRVAEALFPSISLLVRRMRQTRDETLTMPEASALARLEHGGSSTVTALAKLEQISAQSLGATLNALEERGLIKRNPDPSDGRQSLISITKTGKDTLRSRRSARAKQLARALAAGFTRAEIDQLLAVAPLLERLAHNI